ncbi:MAG: beta strand repeat-containing protein, partial [Bacteroidota bacterium]
WTQQGKKLVGTGAVGNPLQGWRVALSADGNTAIIAGLFDNGGTGAAWVWTRSSGTWTQQGNKLVGSGVIGISQQGNSVGLSADGNTAIVGGSTDDGGAGGTWIWTRNGVNWTQQGSKLVGTGATGNSNQGYGVAISADGNTALIGAYGDNGSIGAARIWTRSGTSWTQQGSKLVGTGAVGSAQMGFVVALSADGNTALIGGNADSSNTGATWIFSPIPEPTISNFSPTSAAKGETITINGTNLIGTSAITLGGTSVASFTVVSSTAINAVVGNGATGALSLVTPGGSASSPGFIFISPAPSVNSLSTVTCSGTSFSLSPVNGINGKIPDGTIYSWSVPSLNAGLSGGVSSSNQTFISGTLLNSSGKVQTAVYTVVPSHPTFGNGVPFTVTIFVQPELVITPLSITGCGKMIFKTIPLTNTSGPVSDSSLHIWTTPNQTVSFITRVRPQNNFYSVDSVNWINEFNFNKRFYYFPNPSGSCFGPNYRLDVYLNPVPSINAMTSTSCSGLPFVLSPSNGANGIVPDSISFSWNVPLLSASLTGGTSGANLSAITGQFFNSSNVTQTATYSITPLSTNGNCPGDPFTLTVSVNPTPAITPMTITACRRVTFTAVAFNGTNGLVPTNTRYTWGIPTQTASIVGGRSGVNQPFLVDTLANESNRLQEAYYTLTPSAGNCVGKNFTLTVSINPVPVIKEIISEVCSGATFLVSPTNGTDGIVPSGVRYVWNAPTVTSGITGGQSNNAPPNIFGTLRNTTDTTQTATYYVSPLGTTCGFGPVFTLTVSVLPTPSIQNLSITTNSGVPFAITPVNLIDGIVPTGTLYSWNVPTFNGTATGGQAGTNRSSILGTLQNTSAVLQSATYIVTPATGNCNGLSFTVSVNINPQLIIQSFNPISAGKGLTVTIRGKGFASVNRVSFGGTVALSYTIVSDTTMNAVVGDGNSGFVKIESAYVKDSLAGFTWGSPVIQIGTPDSISVFGAERGKFSPTQSYLVSGQFLQSSLIINAPDSFQISRSVTGSFVKTISIEPINGTIDTSRIFVRFKSDAPGVFSGIISHSSTAAINKSLSVTGNANCDSVVYLTPVINNIKTDTVICFKDSVTLNVSNGTFSKYFWSNGDSTNKLVIKNSGTFNVKVSSGNGCISYQSLNIRTNKNTNTTPSLALVGNRLISTSAPRYRWLFNNNYVPGNTSNGIVPNKVGLYAVETSNDSICWDRSLDYPILVLSTPLVNDTLNVKIFPNPTSTGTFFVVASLKKVTNVVVRVTVSDAN